MISVKITLPPVRLQMQLNRGLDIKIKGDPLQDGIKGTARVKGIRRWQLLVSKDLRKISKAFKVQGVNQHLQSPAYY